MKKLVFVCRGNKFRSPVAEALFNQNPIEGWKAFSYGTQVEKEGWQKMKLSEFGRGIQIIIDEMKKLNIDISDKQCIQIFPEYLKDIDKVIILAEKEFVPDWLAKYNYDRWEIPNPEFVPDDNGRSIIELLSNKINTLKDTL